jgi:cell wall-associated NlpC family hydrolase
MSFASADPFRLWRPTATAAALLLLLATPVRAGEPTDSTSQPPTAASAAWRGAQDLAIFALGLVGVDYRFGGSTPLTGVDCSGLVRYVFQQVTGVTLPRTAREMARLGRNVAPPDLQAGDLVFFNTRSAAYSHVGIYLGDDRFVHAPSPGGGVEIVALSERYWHQRYNGARRLAAAALPDGDPLTRRHADAP